MAVVDDDDRVLESLENLLQSAGHAVRPYSSATALLDGLDLADIDCLISDVGMPEIGGFELERLAKLARPELPVILITGRDELTVAQRTVKSPPQAFFHKPFRDHELLAAVADAVATSRTSRRPT